MNTALREQADRIVALAIEAVQILRSQGIDPDAMLQNNDAYHTLQKSGGLIITGPTGTNVNDVAVVLISG